MKKIILTAVMSLSFLYIGLIDFSYAEDLAEDFSEITGTEIAEENTPMILAQQKSTISNYQFLDPYGTKKDEEKEEDDDDDHGAGVRQKQKNKKSTTEIMLN